jgi:hypothetical protein
MELIKSFPTIKTAAETYVTAAIRAALRKINEKDARQELQNEVEKIAVWMYAFLLINFRSFSRHQKQHWQQHNRHCAILLSTFLASRCNLAMIARMSCTMAIKSDPKAAVPV